MDDGTEIVLKVTIDKDSGTAVFDWTGTGPQVHGNVSGLLRCTDKQFNMPPSLTHAAIIYSLRSMIRRKSMSFYGQPFCGADSVQPTYLCH